jgi:uncharacterized protein (TIGR01732 family)
MHYPGHGYGCDPCAPGYGVGYGVIGSNGFTLLVVLFILLIIVGNSYPTGGAIT